MTKDDMSLYGGSRVLTLSKRQRCQKQRRPSHVHPFPARMGVDLASSLIVKAEGDRDGPATGSDQPMMIVDPMVGSGTVLAAARERGHHAIGFDVDPLAAMLARVSVMGVQMEAAHPASWVGVECQPRDTGGGPNAEHATLRRVFLEASHVLHAAREDVSGGVRGLHGHDFGMDKATAKFVRYWFNPCVARQLHALATRIADLNAADVRAVLWCAFSRMIIAKQAGVSRAVDLAHSRPHRTTKAKPKMPFDRFFQAVHDVYDAMTDPFDYLDGSRFCGNGGGGEHAGGPVSTHSEVSIGDARHLALADGSADMVLTSPPYITAIDYLRCSKFSLVWMGYSVERIREIRSTSIGTDVRESGRDADADDGNGIDAVLSMSTGRSAAEWGDRRYGILSRYVRDMRRVVAETARILVDNGTAAFVVGTNRMAGCTVRTPDMLRTIMVDMGMRVEHVAYRDIPSRGRYLPPPPPQSSVSDDTANTMNARMRREAIITATKS